MLDKKEIKKCQQPTCFEDMRGPVGWSLECCLDPPLHKLPQLQCMQTEQRLQLSVLLHSTHTCLQWLQCPFPCFQGAVHMTYHLIQMFIFKVNFIFKCNALILNFKKNKLYNLQLYNIHEATQHFMNSLRLWQGWGSYNSKRKAIY